jgi:hypothetical protein
MLVVLLVVLLLLLLWLLFFLHFQQTAVQHINEIIPVHAHAIIALAERGLTPHPPSSSTS